MTKPNPYLWPRSGWLFIRDGRGRELDSSADPRYDLADNVMPGDFRQRTVVIAFSIDAGEAISSEIEALRIENLIRYDFGMDGYGVTLTKLRPTGLDTYTWRARVRTRIS